MSTPRAILAAALALLVLAGCSAPARARWSAPEPSAVAATQDATRARDEVLAAGGPVFGVDLPEPTPQRLDAAAAAAGCRPRWVGLYRAVAHALRRDDLAAVPGVPLVSLEPWSGAASDPKWTLAATINGSHDDAYRQIAGVLRDYGKPVVVRFAHEMNGTWYPWGVVKGNSAGQYVQAWRHVVALFRAAGAMNVTWVWSPNVLRGAVDQPLSAFYPGDEWTDLVGLTGYGEFETGPAVTYAGSLRQLEALTAKPVIITEVGVRPSAQKTAWIARFGGWLHADRRIVGFVWSQRNGHGDGARFDWRFDDNAADLSAFRGSLLTGGVAC